jgi:hypothetical protein
LLNSAFPGPSSTILKFLGFSRFSQKEIIQTPNISPNNFETEGAVIKSPFSPKGIFLE